jgi:hypothetical protein
MATPSIRWPGVAIEPLASEGVANEPPDPFDGQQNPKTLVQ